VIDKKAVIKQASKFSNQTCSTGTRYGDEQKYFYQPNVIPAQAGIRGELHDETEFLEMPQKYFYVLLEGHA